MTPPTRGQKLAVLLALPLCPFWLFFAVVTFPWIVPADSNWSLADAHSQAAKAGLVLAAVSMLSLLWVAGVFGRLAAGPLLGWILLAVLVLAGGTIVVSVPDSLKLWFAFAALALGAISMTLGIAAGRSTSEDHDSPKVSLSGGHCPPWCR